MGLRNLAGAFAEAWRGGKDGGASVHSSADRGRPSSDDRAKKWRGPKFWPLIIGAAFILLAIALEHPDMLGGAHAAGDGEAGAHSVIFGPKTVILWVAEIGYAFVIAGIVSWFIETSARREQNDEAREAREAISKDVFSAVFGIKHSPDYVRAVIGNCLETPLIREDYEVVYDIDPFPGDEAARLRIDPDRFVLVTASVRYTARNIGPERESFPTAYGIPVRSGGLRDLSKMNALQIGGRTYSEAEIAACEDADGHAGGDRCYRFEVELDPRESTTVALTVTLVKELSDNDSFGFRRPTMGGRITLNLRVPGLKFGMTPRTSATFKEIRSPAQGRTGEWRLEGPILPYDSVILWWRSLEDDGAATEAAAAPVAASVADANPALPAPPAQQPNAQPKAP